MNLSYEYSLAITSQFPFCSIPLRLDSYSRCQFACRYCFAAARGGAATPSRVKKADPEALARRLDRLENGGKPRSVLDEMLVQKIPIHFGGVSDPFMPMEAREEVSLRFLRILSEHNYPTVISTKSTLCASSKYLEILSKGQFVVQVSIPGISDQLVKRTDVGVPTATERLAAISILSSAGVTTACRLQPLLEVGSRAEDLINACAEAGARQVSVEHLKLAVDNDVHRQALSAAVGRDLEIYYKTSGALRVGREWILPVDMRIDRVLALRKTAHLARILFGAADSDLLHLSDGTSCCSSVDKLGLATTYRFTFTQAVRAHDKGKICFSGIANEWRPSRSVARYVNSRSRIIGGTMEDYIRTHWNGFRHGSGLESFYGVNRVGERDCDGFDIYVLSAEAQKLICETEPAYSALNTAE
jgi:DNA repair photolyase